MAGFEEAGITAAGGLLGGLFSGLSQAQIEKKKRAAEMQKESFASQKESGNTQMQGEQNAFQSLMQQYGKAMLR